MHSLMKVCVLFGLIKKSLRVCMCINSQIVGILMYMYAYTHILSIYKLNVYIYI